MDTRKYSPLLLILALFPALLLASCTLSAGADSATPISIEPDALTVSQTEDQATEAPTPRPATPPESCPVTRPPDPPFVPPHTHEVYPYEGYFWYGTPELWTDLPVDGTWTHLPHAEGKGYGQKVVFWNETYDWMTEQIPDLTLRGRRLDGEAPEFVTDHATNGYHDLLESFILTGAEIPTLGCWELTANYRDAELTFVVWVTNTG